MPGPKQDVLYGFNPDCFAVPFLVQLCAEVEQIQKKEAEMPESLMVEKDLADHFCLPHVPVYWVSQRQESRYRLLEMAWFMREDHAEQDRVFLGIVRQYKPKILRCYREYELEFDRLRWYVENRFEMRENRLNILMAEAIDLTIELDTRLDTACWPYARIPSFNTLITTHNGYIRTDRVRTYWDGLEKFLLERAQRGRHFTEPTT